MRKFGLLISAVILSACAGMPPEWWNPGNVYSPQAKTATKTQAKPAAQQRAAVTSAQPTEPEIPAEQPLNWTEEAFEEMALDPLDANAEDASLPAPSILGD